MFLLPAKRHKVALFKKVQRIKKFVLKKFVLKKLNAMAKRKYSKRNSKRRPYRKRRFSRKRFYRRNRGRIAPSGMPQIRRSHMRVTNAVSLSLTSGAMQYSPWYANGIEEPSAGAATHPPMGYSEWGNLFNHYMVSGSKITVKIVPLEDNTDPFWCGVYLSDGTGAAYSQFSSYVEAKRGTYRLVPNQPGKAVHLVNKYSARRFFNVTDPKDCVARLGSPVGSNPSEVAVFQIWAQPVSSTVSMTLRCIVTIDYIVDWSEPSDLAPSA